jgi:uncharacterized protein YgiM (DUF1202 family)
MKLRTLTTNILGVLIMVGAATGLSLAAMAKPSLHWKSQAVTEVKPVVVTPAPVVEATPVPAATPAPVATPAPRTATTKSFVRLRKAASTSSDILVELDGGTVVTLLADENSLWQQVQFGNLIGYIYKSYLTY